MARTVNIAGTGLQLWEVARMYVELYSSWPGTPSEVWTSEVLNYRLPRSRLGGCLEGELQVVTRPGRLPAGFVASSLPGQPVRCSLTGMDRVALIIAVLPNGDEVVIYACVIGVPKAAEPRLWQIPLIAPDSLRMQAFVGSTSGFPPTPAGLAPLSATRRIYGGWSVPDGTATPHTTFEQWWKLALQADPMAEYCVGPDLVFAAGNPGYSPAVQVIYPLDSRAYGLQSAGRSVTPYLTQIRRWAHGTSEFQPAAEDELRSAYAPAFAPTRTAAVGGSIVSNVVSSSLDCVTSGGGDVSLDATHQFRSRILRADIPAYSGRLQDVTMVGHIDIGAISGVCNVYLLAQAHTTAGPFIDLYRDRKSAISGAFDIAVKADAKSLAGCDYLSFIIGMEGEPGATVTATVSPGPASMRYEYTTYNYTFEAAPPGLNYPAITGEAWNFSLPGIHAGPLLVTALPDGAQEFAATVINNDGTAIWTEVQCGPLPYQSSPVDGSGRWTG